MENSKFLIFENVKGKTNFSWLTSNMELPNDTQAFSVFNQNELDDFGCAKKTTYEIGVPVSIVMGNVNYNADGKYYLHMLKGSQQIDRLKKDTILVSNFNELLISFEEIKKETFEIKK